jgi:hypothetical protein
MRQQFVRVVTREEAEERCPWASAIVETVGGFRCFESVADFEAWSRQRRKGEYDRQRNNERAV